jgi:hypothetical protein
MIVEIFVAAAQGINPLPQKVQYRMFRSLRIAIVSEAPPLPRAMSSWPKAIFAPETRGTELANRKRRSPRALESATHEPPQASFGESEVNSHFVQDGGQQIHVDF